jgi:hypothetical protein
MATIMSFPLPLLWLKVKPLVVEISSFDISEHMSLHKPIFVWFQIDMLPLRVLTITMITDDMILLLPMSIALDISHKTSCVQSKT